MPVLRRGKAVTARAIVHQRAIGRIHTDRGHRQRIPVHIRRLRQKIIGTKRKGRILRRRPQIHSPHHRTVIAAHYRETHRGCIGTASPVRHFVSEADRFLFSRGQAIKPTVGIKTERPVRINDKVSLFRTGKQAVAEAVSIHISGRQLPFIQAVFRRLARQI